MSVFRAVLWLDHRTAHLIPLGTEQMQVQNLHAHSHDTRQHGSTVRTEHEFFGSVCDALGGIKEVLVTGPHLAQSDFRRYIEKHRPAVSPQVIGWDTVDHPTPPQLVALARQFFDRHDRMAGIATS
jgi:stalled ribosome rescue protein Dom34